MPRRRLWPAVGATRRAQQGLSILEFTLVVCIVSVLLVFGATRVMELRVNLEEAAIEHTLAGMRGALALEFATLIVQGKQDEIEAWNGGNPLELFESRNIFDAEPGALPGPGDWTYEHGEVVYRPAYPNALTGDPEAIGRWRVAVSGGTRPTSLELITVQPLASVKQKQQENQP